MSAAGIALAVAGGVIALAAGAAFARWVIAQIDKLDKVFPGAGR